MGSASVPFIAYFPAVVAASIYGGVGPGLLVVLLSASLAHFFFIAPTFTLRFAGTGDKVALTAFVAASSIIVLLNELRDRAAAEAKRQQSLAVQREKQLQVEVQERDRARKEAADAQRWADDTLASIGDGVICTDLDGKITFLNPRAEQL